MRYFISLIFLITTHIGIAQEADVDEGGQTQEKPQEIDTVEADYMPTGIRFGMDAMAIGYTLANERINSHLFIADIDFHRYFLVMEYGRYERTRDAGADLYNTNGSYWRVGADINLFKKSPEKSVLFFGVRYGSSSFSDKLTGSINDPVYGPQPDRGLHNNDVKADWFELVAGLKVPVWKLWFGYNLRMKFGIDKFEDHSFRPYEVPGYGIAAEKDYWEFNYYIMYRIAWRD